MAHAQQVVISGSESDDEGDTKGQLGRRRFEKSKLTKHCLLIRALFLKYNTGLPSSAPVERLFSLCGQVLVPRRCRLSDARFEMLALLRANHSLLAQQ